MKSVINTPLKVSVIMPVYNTEEYVEQAMKSIQEQSLQALEIIVVNDGSTDGSPGVIERLAKSDPRVKVYSQPNGGQSVARNNALQFATGKYVYFMDSDDVIEPDTLEACVEKADKESLDFVFFDADILNKESLLSMPLLYNRSGCVDETTVYNGKAALQKQLDARCYTPSPCLSLVRTDLLRRLSLGFYPGIIHEDQLFSALLYLQADRVMYIRQKFFKRRFREASTMTQRFSWRNIKGYLTVTEELLRFKKQKADEEQGKVIHALLKQMLDAVFWNAHVLPLRQRAGLFLLCFRRHYKRYVSSRTLTVMMAKSAFR